VTIRRLSNATSVAILVLAATGASAGEVNDLPDGWVRSPDSAAVAYMPVDRLKNGCLAYAKRALDPALVVDAAIWYRRADGTFTTDASACHPTPAMESR
jgi:hypothetical protein